MSKVTINVNNKSFTIACDDGQEARVQQLGRYVDERFRELNSAGAAPNESYMLVLTALVIADDMFEAKDAAEKATIAAGNAGPSRPEIQAQFEREYNQMRGQYEARIAQLQADLDRARHDARESAGNVTDLNRIRAEADAQLKAREAEIAKAVDSLTDKLEGVVKKLKRA